MRWRRRVALVRHRRRALLARPRETALDLPDLCALEVADLGGEALEPRARKRDRPSSSAWRSRGTTCVETSSRARPAVSARPLEPRGRSRRRSDRARERSHRQTPLDRPLHLIRLRCASKRSRRASRRTCGFRVHTVRAPHADRVHVLTRAANQGGLVVRRAAHQDHPGLRELKAESGVEHVRRGRPCDPAARIAN